jgi:hypothetical protein
MALVLNTKPKIAPKATSNAGNRAVSAASEYRDIALKLETLKTELTLARVELLDVVVGERDKKMKTGENGSSIKIPTLDGNKVQVIFQERFRGLDVANVPALQGAFGSEYSLLCESKTAVKLAKGATLLSIEKALGKQAFAKVLALLDVTETVVPRKGAFDNIARLYAEGEDEKAADLTMFVDATVSSPQVRAK